ncbi:hypothetical protein tloyanaT_36300 [Thalassotalea loyana]|uniref:Uncharacterized protein n=1 Tax=Thalassotalea loyana TaxID=280483 RepID=A0ABQ6HK18_9GAMM|nr:hypothetical protein [Thalassotalea loyana]GLX87377.1 hypothetical protein tloyanaT_36300 [Thalassotalea loyana]
MMNKTIRYIVILSLLVLAIVFYSLGSIHELFILLILGFCFEAAFWIVAFRDHKREKRKAAKQYLQNLQ